MKSIIEKKHDRIFMNSLTLLPLILMGVFPSLSGCRIMLKERAKEMMIKTQTHKYRMTEI